MALARTDPQWKRARRQSSSIRERRVALTFRRNDRIRRDAQVSTRSVDVRWGGNQRRLLARLGIDLGRSDVVASERDEWIPALRTASCNGSTIFITRGGAATGRSRAAILADARNSVRLGGPGRGSSGGGRRRLAKPRTHLTVLEEQPPEAPLASGSSRPWCCSAESPARDVGARRAVHATHHDRPVGPQLDPGGHDLPDGPLLG